MKILDTISIAYRTVRGNKLRTGITVAIIAFGIMALVGIITAIEAMLYFLLVGEIKEYSLTENRFTSKDAGMFERQQKQVAKRCTAGNHAV